MVFIFSGISKLISVVYFEQFIYSFGILKLNYAVIFARIIIAAELTFGLSYLFKVYLKQINYISILILVAFTLFILLIEITDFSDDCHCFGNLFIFSNKLSILKNIVLIVMAIFLIKPLKQKTINNNGIKLISISVLSLIISLAVYFPSNIFSKKNLNSNFCKTCLEEYTKRELLSDQKIVLCFFSTSCKYCQLAAKNMSVISRKTNGGNKILYVLWESNTKSKQFLQETKSDDFTYKNMDVLSFIKLTNGQMPQIILYNKGVIEHSYYFSDMDEDKIIEFINSME